MPPSIGGNGLDINAMSTVLKNTFGNKAAILQYSSSSPRWKAVKKTQWGFGLGLFQAVQTGDIQSIGTRNSGPGVDGQALPDPTAPQWAQPSFGAVRRYQRMTVTGKAASYGLNNDQKQSFLHNVADVTASGIRAFNLDIEFGLFNQPTASGNFNGCRGILTNAAYPGGGNAGNAQTYTLDTTTAAGWIYGGLQGLYPGMKLDVVNITTKTVIATITVVWVDDLGLSFTGYSDNNIPAASLTNYLWRSGDFANGDITGLGSIIDDGTYTTTYGNVVTGGYWKSFVLANSGALRDFTPELLNEIQTRAEKRNDGLTKNEAWMTFGMKKELLNYIQRTLLVQKDGESKAPFKVNIGGDIEEWGPSLTVKCSRAMLDHQIHIIAPTSITMQQQVPMGPLVLDGATREPSYWQRIPGFDNYEAVLCCEQQQITYERNRNFKVVDLNQTLY